MGGRGFPPDEMNGVCMYARVNYRIGFTSFRECIENTQAPRDWLGALGRFLDRAHECGKLLDVATVQALCVRLAGDFVAGQVLKQVFWSYPKATTGWYYMPDTSKKIASWKSLYGLSTKVMKRIRNNDLEGLLLMKYKKSHYGAPMWHYRPDVDGLLNALADLVNQSAMMVRAVVFEKPVRVMGKVEFDHSSETLTKDSANDSNKQESESLSILSLPKREDCSEAEWALIGFGLDAKTAKREAYGLSIEQVQACIASTKEAAARGHVKKSKKAYLRGALRIQRAEGAQPSGTGDAGIAPTAQTVRDYETVIVLPQDDYTGGEFADFIES